MRIVHANENLAWKELGLLAIIHGPLDKAIAPLIHKIQILGWSGIYDGAAVVRYASYRLHAIRTNCWYFWQSACYLYDSIHTSIDPMLYKNLKYSSVPNASRSL
jgi:hypothetical protein